MFELLGAGDRETTYVRLQIIEPHKLWLKSGRSAVDDASRSLGQSL